MKNKVELLRKELGINQGDFAKALGVSRQTISSIENGKYNPSLELAFAISHFFGRTIEDIFIPPGNGADGHACTDSDECRGAEH